MPARSISCSAWPAATSTFFGVQPRFGQVPPSRSASIIATDMPARLTGPVTPMPALPPPRMTTSNFSDVIEPIPLLAMPLCEQAAPPARPVGLTAIDRLVLPGRDGRGDRADHFGRHLELRGAIPDVVAFGDPSEIGPDRPDVAIVILRQQQPDRPVEAGIRVRGDELGPERGIAEHQQRRGAQLDAGVGCELRLVDLHEELDAFAGDIGLDAGNRLGHRHRALDPDNAVIAIGGSG